MLLVLEKKNVFANPQSLWTEFIRCLSGGYFRPPTPAQAELEFCFWYYASLNHDGSHQTYLETVEPEIDLAYAHRALRRVGAELYYENLAKAVRQGSYDAYKAADGVFWYIQTSKINLLTSIRLYLLSHLEEFFLFRDE